MTTDLTILPTPTPRLTLSLSPEECVEHRKRLSVEVEIILQSYWQAQLPPEMKGAVLADWCDELEDWTVDQVRWGLRNWRNSNPSKKPNPAHIVEILKARRGRELAVKPVVEPERLSPFDMSPEQLAERKKQGDAIVSGFAKSHKAGG